MLQLPHEMRSRPARSLAQPLPRSKVSTVEAAIEAHRKSMRLYRVRSRKYEALLAAHPDLDGPLPDGLSDRQRQAAFKERRTARKAVGITKLEIARHQACMDEVKTFNRFIKTKPKSEAEIALFARHLIGALKKRYGSPFHHARSDHIDNTPEGMKDFECRIWLTQSDMATALYALAR